MCPDGKLEVGGAPSSWGTVGRCLSTIIVVRMNRPNSSVSAKNRKANCRQNLPRTSATPVIAETARITAVDPRSEPNRVTVFSDDVRSGTNHRIQLASSLPRPAGSRTCVSSKPSPTIAAPSTTNAIAHTITAASNGRCAPMEWPIERAIPPGCAENAFSWVTAVLMPSSWALPHVHGVSLISWSGKRFTCWC